MITVTDVWPVIQLIITNLSMVLVQKKILKRDIESWTPPIPVRYLKDPSTKPQAAEYPKQIAHGLMKDRKDDARLEESVGQKDPNENQRCISSNLSVFLQGLVGEETLQDVGAVQRGDGQKVEDPEADVHEHESDQEGDVEFGGEKKKPEDHACRKGSGKIGKGAAQGDQEAAHSGVPEVSKVNRYRLGPSETEQEKAKGAQWVNVAYRIQGQPAGILGSGIPQGKGDPPVGIFMNGDCKEQDPQSDDPLCDVMSHGLFLFLSYMLAAILP